MTDVEYEEAYREALLCIPVAYTIGRPLTLPGGRRICEINGINCYDDDVFRLGWGHQLAEQIRRERYWIAREPIGLLPIRHS